MNPQFDGPSQCRPDRRRHPALDLVGRFQILIMRQGEVESDAEPRSARPGSSLVSLDRFRTPPQAQHRRDLSQYRRLGSIHQPVDRTSNAIANVKAINLIRPVSASSTLSPTTDPFIDTLLREIRTADRNR